MKRLFVILVVLLLTTMGAVMMAHDVVYLKNGSIIKGKVIEVVPSESVQVQTQDGSLFVYSMDEIDRISNEENADNTESYLKRGFRGIPDLSIHAGLNDGSNIMFMASYTAGYQINRLIFLGGGIAPAYDLDYEFILPIYSAIRFDFANSQISPFLDARLGYAIDSGAYTYIGGGCRIKKLSLSGGYSFIQTDDYWYGDLAYLGLRVGYEF